MGTQCINASITQLCGIQSTILLLGSNCWGHGRLAPRRSNKNAFGGTQNQNFWQNRMDYVCSKIGIPFTQILFTNNYITNG
jgi:hypothetical protein